MRIRPANAADRPAVRSIHAAAFPTSAEADLVDLLVAHAKDRISLVAERDGELLGHVLFSPVTIEGVDDRGLGLAPVAVLPSHQGRGVGGELIRAGLAACRELECPYVVVLGAPGYYHRFGFARASDRGLRNEYGCDDEFMVHELSPDSLPPAGGLVRYAEEFAAVDDG